MHARAQVSSDVKYTYLDVSGRPVVVVRKSHVVPEHGSAPAQLVIEYSFPATGVLREPAMLVTGVG
jgi:oligosaccharyltransferase complex subunit alpha (ribophorin I)